MRGLALVLLPFGSAEIKQAATLHKTRPNTLTQGRVDEGAVRAAVGEGDAEGD